MKEAYLIIKTGCEGIEELCFLTSLPKEAIEKTMELKRTILEEKEKAKIRDRKDGFSNHESFYDFIYNPDFYCVQKWDGEKFKCACSELGVKPSKLMLR